MESIGRVSSWAEVTVWEADGLVDGCVGYGHHLALGLMEAGLSVNVVPLAHRSPSAAELDAPFHVVSGGSTPVTADVAWLASARDRLSVVLDAALRGERTVTGVCFGAQLIAHVLAGPGAVTEHPGGMQAGLIDALDVTTLQVDAVASFHYHQVDRAVLVAAGGRVSMTSAATPVQAFGFGRDVVGVQFHPELGPDAFTETLFAQRDVLAANGADVSAALDSVATQRGRCTRSTWDRFVLEPALRRLRPEGVSAPAA